MREMWQQLCTKTQGSTQETWWRSSTTQGSSASLIKASFFYLAVAGATR